MTTLGIPTARMSSRLDLSGKKALTHNRIPLLPKFTLVHVGCKTAVVPVIIVHSVFARQLFLNEVEALLHFGGRHARTEHLLAK